MAGTNNMKEYRDKRELREPGYKKILSDKALAYYYKNRETIIAKRKKEAEAMVLIKIEARRLLDKEI